MRRSIRNALVICLLAAIAGAAVATVAWNPSDPSNETRPVLVVAGDSYASGEGLAPYLAGSDTASNSCHRSASAFAGVVGRTLDYDTRNVACSGATSNSMTTPVGGEVPQVQQTKDADAVVVLVGGNDIDALRTLVSGAIPADTNSRLAALRTHLADLYGQIRTGAPNADVFAMSYPLLLAETAQAQCPVSPALAGQFLEGNKALNTTIAAAAADANVHFLDVSGVFAGHELCTADPWINGLNLVNLSSSLHPNEVGQKAMGELVASQVSARRQSDR